MTIDELRKILSRTTKGDWSSTHIFAGEEVLRTYFPAQDQHMPLGVLRYEPDGKFVEIAHAIFPKLLDLWQAAKAVEASCQMGPDGCTVDAGVMMDLNEAFEALETTK